MWPGASSDYIAWILSDLHRDLEIPDKNMLLPGKTIVGDNAYTKSAFMSVPFQGSVNGYEDAYNFYHSQLRITIKRAFGVLVHRWAILRGLLNIPIRKVGPLAHCLCALHNFCINEKESFVERTRLNDGRNIQRAVNVDYFLRHPSSSTSDGNNDDELDTMISIQDSTPNELLGGGHHFNDAPDHRHERNIE